jgi:SAM-dependent methyltransferase
MGLDASEFHKQTEALLRLGNNDISKGSLLSAQTRLFHSQWSKDYYEPCREDMVAFFPKNTRSVLSIGTGWGATEAALVRNGVCVVGIPLDPVIASCAESRGVEIIHGDLDTAFARLAGREFDGVLISSVLHLLPDPAKVLQRTSSLLAKNGVMVASLPNLARLPLVWRRLRYPSRYRGIGNYQWSGMHAISRGTARALFSASGLKIIKIADAVPPNWRRTVALSGGVASPLFSSEFIAVGRRVGLQGDRESYR